MRNVPAFKVMEHGNVAVKTRSVADVAPVPKATPATTRNKSKAEKVRTRGDGPAKSVELTVNCKKAQKRPKVDVPKPTPRIDDGVDVSVNKDPQPPPAKVKRTARKH